MLRLTERGVVAVQLLEALLVRREPEEPVLLLKPLELEGRMVGTSPVNELCVRLELVVARAVPPRVHALVDVAGIHRALDHLGRSAGVIWIGGPYESVVADRVPVERRL